MPKPTRHTKPTKPAETPAEWESRSQAEMDGFLRRSYASLLAELLSRVEREIGAPDGSVLEGLERAEREGAKR